MLLGRLGNVCRLHRFGARTTVPADRQILEFDRVDYKTPLGATFTALYSATIVLHLASLGAIFYLRNDPKMTKRSPAFNAVILIGLIIFLITVYFNVVMPTRGTCVAERWTQGVGFSIVMVNQGPYVDFIGLPD